MNQIEVKTSKATFINSKNPNKNYNMDNALWVGRQGKRDGLNSLLYFDISQLKTIKEVKKATLKLYFDFVPNPNVESEIRPYLISESWNVKTVTWLNSPDISCLKGNSINVCQKGVYELDVTPIIKTWLEEIYPNYGILLGSRSNRTDDYKRIYKYNKNNPCDFFVEPTLIVEYEKDITAINKSFIIGRQSFEALIEKETQNDFRYSEANNTSDKTLVTYFIKNIGEHTAQVKLQVSGNHEDYVDDTPEFEIAPLETIALVPKIYGKYTRVAFKSHHYNASTTLKINFQSCV
ncbi:hypothetical protein EDC19_1044 [Natranaerovirga hydrolytica]|uniref:DNRLRE domain-containing protein n=1 Tax=Natranaerovirga hydrolytica TaxID=680378 RepID=A0A4R1N128_9FIRM|nr:DNRLRE domain-containing protein [Natranaerovirga hydrolytica]TCK98612.1 hypothetical protein EDC19_1044 [Natranaerovirga hydrolytica]